MISDKVNVAIIGVGYWGPNLVRSFDNIVDCHVSWVCEARSGRQKYIKSRFPHLEVTGNYSELLEDDSVDAIVIATPPSTHCALANLALKAGKHVMVEKPLADTSSKAQEIVGLAKQKGLVLATGHIFVYHPAVSKMKEIIMSGGIGRLCYVESSRANVGPPDPDLNVIWDLGVHDVAILLYLWGEQPEKVTAHGRCFSNCGLYDTAFINIEFPDGTMAQHNVSWMSPLKIRQYLVVGTKGVMVFDDVKDRDKLKIIGQSEDSRVGAGDDEVLELFYRPGKIMIPELSEVEPLMSECRHFLDCVRNSSKPKADGNAGLDVVRTLEAADRSIREGSCMVYLAGEPEVCV